MLDHQVGRWLRTEYDTAVIRAHRGGLAQVHGAGPHPAQPAVAAYHQRHARHRAHKQFWSIEPTLPIEHPLECAPPGRPLNCHCSLEATDDALRWVRF